MDMKNLMTSNIPSNSVNNSMFQNQYQTGWLSGLTGGDVDKAANVAMAEVNRQFQMREAQKARDYQERLSNTAYQRQVADMKKAGINPALMFAGKGGMSGASTPSASASTAGSVAQQPNNQANALAGIIGAIAFSSAKAVSYYKNATKIDNAAITANEWAKNRPFH